MSSAAPCDCPERGLPNPAEWCFDHIRTDGHARWFCTRPAGHDGPHSACYDGEHPAETWEDGE